MPRRARKAKRGTTVPDAKYNSATVAKLINAVMMRGQKATAERIVYDAMDLVSRQLSGDPAELLEQAVVNATPLLKVKPRRVGGATYQVPMEVERGRGRSIAMRWLIASARGRTGKTMKDRLATELLDAIQGRGATVKKRDDIHRMAEANRAFAHYRW
ncbi:MAG: 30S ribosomal protein S7 [Dehalococcoidia bacterium]|nr:30S ribosomal protein S7 [Chloroflexota bacterium]MCK4222009.1 30S ribosomal protein S7 [Dehalococcoidia bacterium]MCK4262527.1 30S ribosomal protein S7 [Dehalococcoidia bacterium]MCK4581054.1 30S ribosomal protein S7 [Dehalococcoidia bacterium]